jgi:hypothetical protein
LSRAGGTNRRDRVSTISFPGFALETVAFRRRAIGAPGESTQRGRSSRVGSRTRKSPNGRRKRCLVWDRVSGRCRQQPQRCDGHHFASILGPAFETLKALISGPSVFVPKLTGCETTVENQAQKLRHSREMTLLCSRDLTQATRLRRG